MKQDQTLETSPDMLKVPSKQSGKRKKYSAPRHKDTICNEKKEALAALLDNANCELDNKNPKRTRGNEVLSNTTPLPDLNGDGRSTDKFPTGFDLNQISVKATTTCHVWLFLFLRIEKLNRT